MHAWIFRNRVSLQRIYGCVPPPPLAGARFAGRPAPALPERPPRRLRPGELARRARGVELRPMPPRV
jgi:hypothetical protein